MSITGKAFTELTAQQQADIKTAMRGYRLYTAIAYQSGITLNVTVLENTLTWTPTWTRENVGVWRISNLSQTKALNKYFVTHPNQAPAYAGSIPYTSKNFAFYDWKGDKRATLLINDVSTGFASDSVFDGTMGGYAFIEFREYD